MKPLSPREKKMLELLRRKAEVQRKEFAKTLGLDGNQLELAISRLRRKIAPTTIRGVYGGGYALQK